MRKGQSQVVKNKSDHACMSRCVSDDLASEATEKNEVFRGALPVGRKRAVRKQSFSRCSARKEIKSGEARI